MTTLPAQTSVSLLARAMRFFCVYRRERGPQADCAGDCGDDALCTVPGRGLDESGLAAVADGDARALERGAQAFARLRVEGADVFGAQSLSLLQKQVNILVRGERRGLYAQALADLDALAAYAAGGAEDDSAVYHLIFTSGEIEEHEKQIGRSHEEHAVEPVQHAAVAGEDRAVVLNAELALYDGKAQIAQLAEEAADDAHRA